MIRVYKTFNKKFKFQNIFKFKSIIIQYRSLTTVQRFKKLLLIKQKPPTYQWKKASLIYKNIQKLLKYFSFYLTNLKRNNQKLEKNDLFKIIYQMSDALSFLQDHEISHGDIKPENVIITDFTPFTIKLADLGCGDFHDYTQNSLSIKGTVSFMSPELIEKQKNITQNSPQSNQLKQGQNQFKSDVFSLGLLIIFLVNNEKFYSQERLQLSKEIQQEIIQDQLQKFKNNVQFQDQIQTEIKKMLDWKQELRPDFKKVFATFEEMKKQHYQQIFLKLPKINNNFNTPSSNKHSSKFQSRSVQKIRDNSLSKIQQGESIFLKIPPISEKSYNIFKNQDNKLHKFKSVQVVQESTRQDKNNISPWKIFKHKYQMTKPEFDWVFLDGHFENQEFTPVQTLNIVFKGYVENNWFKYMDLVKNIQNLNLIFLDFILPTRFEFRFREVLSKLIESVVSLGLEYSKNDDFLIEQIFPQKCKLKMLYLFPKIENIELNTPFIFESLPELDTLYVRNIAKIPKHASLKHLFSFTNTDLPDLSNIQSFFTRSYNFQSIPKSLLFLQASVNQGNYGNFLTFMQKQVDILTLIIHIDKDVKDIQKLFQIIYNLIHLKTLDLSYHNFSIKDISLLEDLKKYNKIDNITLTSNYFYTDKDLKNIIQNPFIQKNIHQRIFHKDKQKAENLNICTKIKNYFQPLQKVFQCSCGAQLCIACRKKHKNCQHIPFFKGISHLSCYQQDIDVIQNHIEKLILEET